MTIQGVAICDINKVYYAHTYETIIVNEDIMNLRDMEWVDLRRVESCILCLNTVSLYSQHYFDYHHILNYTSFWTFFFAK